jgi:hypothetical protein
MGAVGKLSIAWKINLHEMTIFYKKLTELVDSKGMNGMVFFSFLNMN